MKRAVLVFLVTILLGFVAFTAWYYWPMHREFAMSVCSTEGQLETLKVDISIHRSFFEPANISGTVTLGDMKYVDEEAIGHVPSGEDYTFFEKLGLKYKGVLFWDLRFYYKGEDFLHDITEQLVFHDHVKDYRFDEVHIIVSHLNGTNMLVERTQFFGPAETSEEAAVLEKMFVHRRNEKN